MAMSENTNDTRRIGILEMPDGKFALCRTLEMGYGSEKARALVSSVRRFAMLTVSSPPGFSTSDELDDVLAFVREQWQKSSRDGIRDFYYDMHVTPEVRARVNAFAKELGALFAAQPALSKRGRRVLCADCEPHSGVA